jgi:glucosylceramidase
VKIVILDHNCDLMVERADTVYRNPEAAKFVCGTGFHWYGEDHFEHVQQLHDAWPDKQLLFTEGCQEGGPHHGSWELGERYGRSNINDLNRWTAGWIEWKLLLNEQGGPNHVGNLCSAPLLASAGDDVVQAQSSYWYLGHFVRFIRPGAQRVLCAAPLQPLECTAYVNADGSVTVVAMNRTEETLRFALRLDDASFECELPPRAVVTILA